MKNTHRVTVKLSGPPRECRFGFFGSNYGHLFHYQGVKWSQLSDSWRRDSISPSACFRLDKTQFLSPFFFKNTFMLYCLLEWKCCPTPDCSNCSLTLSQTFRHKAQIPLSLRLLQFHNTVCLHRITQYTEHSKERRLHCKLYSYNIILLFL